MDLPEVEADAAAAAGRVAAPPPPRGAQHQDQGNPSAGGGCEMRIASSWGGGMLAGVGGAVPRQVAPRRADVAGQQAAALGTLNDAGGQDLQQARPGVAAGYSSGRPFSSWFPIFRPALLHCHPRVRLQSYKCMFKSSISKSVSSVVLLLFTIDSVQVLSMPASQGCQLPQLVWLQQSGTYTWSSCNDQLQRHPPLQPAIGVQATEI